jgi:hypothetical protein
MVNRVPPFHVVEVPSKDVMHQSVSNVGNIQHYWNYELLANTEVVRPGDYSMKINNRFQKGEIHHRLTFNVRGGIRHLHERECHYYRAEHYHHDTILPHSNHHSVSKISKQ